MKELIVGAIIALCVFGVVTMIAYNVREYNVQWMKNRCEVTWEGRGGRVERCLGVVTNPTQEASK